MRKIFTLLATLLLVCTGTLSAIAQEAETTTRSWDFTKGKNHKDKVDYDGDYWLSIATTNAKGRVKLCSDIEEKELPGNDGETLSGLEGIYFTINHSNTTYYGITGNYFLSSKDFTALIPNCSKYDKITIKFDTSNSKKSANIESENILEENISTTATKNNTSELTVKEDGDVYLHMTCSDNFRLYTIKVEPGEAPTEPETPVEPEPEPVVDPNEAKSVMLSFADCSQSKEAIDGVDATGDNCITWNNGFKMVIQRTDNKSYIKRDNITIEDNNYATIQLSNGAKNILYAPEGYAITKLTIYSYVNYDKVKKESDGRVCYWKEVQDNTYTEETGTILNCYVSDTDYSKNPDRVEFDINNASSVSFTNTGEQICFVLSVEYVATIDAPGQIHGESFKITKENNEIVFTPASDKHAVYTFFEAKPVVSEPNGNAAEPTIEHDGKTFTLAADNKVTVDKAGTLHYMAVDTETGVKSPVNTIEIINDINSSIFELDTEEAEGIVEYYNLQGVRVANPTPGLYIRKQGNKVEKVYVK